MSPYPKLPLAEYLCMSFFEGTLFRGWFLQGTKRNTTILGGGLQKMTYPHGQLCHTCPELRFGSEYLLFSLVLGGIDFTPGNMFICSRDFSANGQDSLALDPPLAEVIAGDGWGLIAVPVIEKYPATAVIFVGSLLTLAAWFPPCSVALGVARSFHLLKQTVFFLPLVGFRRNLSLLEIYLFQRT